MSKTAIIHVRVTPELHALIRKVATDAQRSLSDWCSIQLAEVAAAEAMARRKKAAR